MSESMETIESKAEPTKNRLLKLELTKERSSRAPGSVVDSIECFGSGSNQKRTTELEKAMTQRSLTSRPLSPDCVFDPPANVTQTRGVKLFSAYPILRCYFNRMLGSFQHWQSRPLKQKPKTHKPFRFMDPHATLTKTTFQQHGTSAFQNRNRSHSLINNS